MVATHSPGEMTHGENQIHDQETGFAQSVASTTLLLGHPASDVR